MEHKSTKYLPLFGSAASSWFRLPPQRLAMDLGFVLAYHNCALSQTLASWLGLELLVDSCGFAHHGNQFCFTHNPFFFCDIGAPAVFLIGYLLTTRDQ